jgi:two-component system, chemotaxis family, protein-glutamate methylesterase/glutaminase
MIKVLVVEDSPVARELLCYILNSDPEIQVIGEAGDGEEAFEFLARKKPDVITMDIYMPRMDGFEVTRRIMETTPVPIIIVSANYEPGEVEMSFRALEEGALTILQKPPGIGHPDFEKQAWKIIYTVKTMSEVKLIKRLPRYRREKAAPPVTPEVDRVLAPAEIKLVAIGGSTGAPPVIQMILSRLSKDFPVPVVLVQHISPGFIKGMIQWLNDTTGFSTLLATHGERLLPGRAYFAPDGFQIGVENGGSIVLKKDPPEHGLCPSVSYLFRSVAGAFGKKAVGVLLTGMGTDGSAELKLMRESGAVTIAQDKESSIVHGMPGKAIELGGARYELNPGEIATMLVELVKKSGI